VNDFSDFMLEQNEAQFEWTISSRADCLDPACLEKMHAAGLRAVHFGIESGSERIQRIIKKNINLDRFELLLKRLRELNIETETSLILGFPEDELSDMDQTVRRALHYCNLGSSKIPFFKLSPLAGTEIYRQHLPHLKQLSYQSTRPSSLLIIGLQMYGLPYIDKLIRTYPALFSSFYHIPHPQMSLDELCKFIDFSQLMVTHNPRMALLAIEHTGLSATQLFKRWDRWAEQHKISDYSFEQFSRTEFRTVFYRFLADTISQNVTGIERRDSSEAQDSAVDEPAAWVVQ
jgi:radical SAM superfamily enzyme YgiQ (UPF0313 family)